MVACAVQIDKHLVSFGRWEKNLPQEEEWFIHNGEYHQIAATGQGKIKGELVPVVVIQRIHGPDFRMIPFREIEYVGNRNRIRKWALKRPKPLRDFQLLQEKDLEEE